MSYTDANFSKKFTVKFILILSIQFMYRKTFAYMYNLKDLNKIFEVKFQSIS